MPSANPNPGTNAGMDVTISMPMGGGQLRADSINVPAKPTGVAEPRSRFRRKCAIGAAVVVTVLGAVFGAMYINVLNNLPQFIDEAGNSTIEVRVRSDNGACTAALLCSSNWSLLLKPTIEGVWLYFCRKQVTFVFFIAP